MHSPPCTLAALPEQEAGGMGHILTHGVNGVKAWPFLAFHPAAAGAVTELTPIASEIDVKTYPFS